MRSTLILAVALLSTAAPVLAAEIVWQDAEVMLRDGDSGYAIKRDTGRIMPIRLLGFDTPEPSANHADCLAERLHGLRAGIEAQRLVTTQPVNVVWQDEDGDGRIDVGRYKRGLGTIHLKEDDQTLYAALIDRGLALPYGGTGRRPDWCRYLKLDSTKGHRSN